MNVAIRVDASIQIGTGHFMRCLTLADALKQRGATIRFISRQLPVYLRSFLTDKGHEFMLLESTSGDMIDDELTHSHWLGTTQFFDAQDSLRVLSDQAWEWLIVDHYALDRRWETSLRSSVKQILVIDDIADRQHYCDVLLDQNFYSDMDTRYTGKVPVQCRLLLGPRYALLREEFRQLHEKVSSRAGVVKRILVFFGGVDADNYTGKAINALVYLGHDELHVDVVIGAQHPYRDEIEALCQANHFTCHVQTSRMAELMAAADLSIGAGGSATWERCCLGLPSLTVSVADNQTEIAKALDFIGATKFIASHDEVVMRDCIYELLHNKSKLELFSMIAYNLVDGIGVDRLCEALIC